MLLFSNFSLYLLLFLCSFHFVLFETKFTGPFITHCIAQTGLKLTILLPQHPLGWQAHILRLCCQLPFFKSRVWERGTPVPSRITEFNQIYTKTQSSTQCYAAYSRRHQSLNRSLFSEERAHPGKWDKDTQLSNHQFNMVKALLWEDHPTRTALHFMRLVPKFKSSELSCKITRILGKFFFDVWI